jgi:hydrogenase maturation protease
MMYGPTSDPLNAPEGARDERPQYDSPRILVIGYGNTLRQDDGLGWIAAHQLQAQHASPQITFITCHQLTMDLAEALSTAEIAILVDAQKGDPPGQISEQIIAADQTLVDTMHHHMEPPALLAYTQALYRQAPLTHLFTITAASFGFGEELSPAVQAALPDLLTQINRVIEAALA